MEMADAMISSRAIRFRRRNFYLPSYNLLIRHWAASFGPNWSSKVFRFFTGLRRGIESRGNQLLCAQSHPIPLLQTWCWWRSAAGRKPVCPSRGIETGVKGAICVNQHMETLYPGYLRSWRLRGDLSPSALGKTPIYLGTTAINRAHRR